MTDYRDLYVQASQVFRPHAPIDQKELFSGRLDQIARLVDAINMSGKHAILFGERGVGKTSLANVAADFLGNQQVLATRINCDSQDTFRSLWEKVFRDIPIVIEQRKSAGFLQRDIFDSMSLADSLPPSVDCDFIRRELMKISRQVLFVPIFDEFDRLPQGEVRTMMSDILKTASDHGLNTTMVFVGIADSVTDLISDHESVERCLEQIKIPRMSIKEVKELLSTRFDILGMTAENGVLEKITTLTQGFPYYAHMIGLESSRAALEEKRLNVQFDDLSTAMQSIVNSVKESIGSKFYRATSSARKETIFKQVLIACALSETDDGGYFSPALVSKPLSEIMGKKYEIPNFANHLSAFSSEKRENVLECREEENGRKKYRFRNPLIQPYIIMYGISKGIIGTEYLESYDQLLTI